MQLSNLSVYVTSSIVNEELLIEQELLLIVIQLEPSTLFTPEHRSERLIDQ